MVFVDTANVRHGPKWPPQIQQALEATGVLLVAVGPQWFSEENQCRLNEQGDWVRLEIARSLERDITIIPVLINGAQRPNPEMLPPSIIDLGKYLTMPLGRENWEGQVRDLIDELVAVGCRRLPMRVILMDSHLKIYGRKENRIPEEMNSHVIRRQLESLPGQTIEIEPVNAGWRGEVGIAARNPSLIIIHYSCLDDGRKAPQRLEQFLERIMGDCPDVEVIVYSRTTQDRSAEFEDEFDEDIKELVSSKFTDRVHGLPVFWPKPRRGQKRQAQTFDDPATARDLRKMVKKVLAIDD
jgi:hypothetical protein